MDSILNIVFSSLPLGLIFALSVLGFAVSLRFLAYADLSLPGSFVLGGTISITLIERGVHPLFAVLAAMLAGGVAGLITGSQHCFLKINKLLSGIITLAILYSVNLRIQVSPNKSYNGLDTIYGIFSGLLKPEMVIGFVTVFGFVLLYCFFKTEFGLFLRACGENEKVVTRSGYSRDVFILVGLFVSNSLIALSGSMFTQYIGFSDINIAEGIIVIALTSLMIGEIIFCPNRVSFFLVAVLAGSVLCQIINTSCLYLDIHPSDHKGVVGVLLILLMWFRKTLEKERSRQSIGADVF
ncbi:hypothetical protein KAR91_07635 [Candidatus Pacearchaeota archaeon]|nr:hypothetical protein [Candidatus Pacearchaeota archaeon]